MEKTTVNASSKKEAAKLCPWAEVIVKVDSGNEKQNAYMCFESAEDYKVWKSQK
jgi:hypothetical protein